MGVREVHILSYFSLETDLAADMRSWAEFVSGEGYEVSLASRSETVDVSLADEEEQKYVIVRGRGAGELFDRVLGRVIHALAAHSDNLRAILVWTRTNRATGLARLGHCCGRGARALCRRVRIRQYDGSVHGFL